MKSSIPPADGDRIRLAIVSSSLSRNAGGILPIMQRHAIGLEKLGVEVSVHGVADEFSEIDREGWGDIPLHLSAPIGPKQLAIAPGMGRSLAAAKPHIVHQHGLWQYPSFAVRRWHRRTGQPFVISAQGMLEEWALANSGWKKRAAGALLERDHLLKASAIHVSRAEVSGVSAYATGTPIACLPNGTDIPDGPAPRLPPFIGQDGRRTLLFLGRLHPKKGIAEILEAWKLAISRNPNIAARWRLVLAGWDDGGHAEAFVSKAQALGLADSVVFPGALFGETKRGALSHADAFILASHSEGLPIAVLEALGHALPVFMTRACNLPELLDLGASIEISTAPDAMSEVLEAHLAGSYESLQRIGSAGQEYARSHFSWEEISTHLLDLYRYILGMNETPLPFLLRTEIA
ncbi:glycosyltransferase [Novosphingobium aquae]|uniref:Glycosyltransferase n=1 Tax=Novosphingobium aquae TaxID=3133435 RepID=A0ABU8SDV5_9SPHN